MPSGSNLTLGPSFDGGNDFVRFLGPGKGLWICIRFVEEAVDGIFEFLHGPENAAREAFLCEIGEEDPLADQHLARATEATAVLFLGGRRFHHRTHSRFTPLVRQQRANQHFAVDPVSLRTPAPTGCRNRGRIHDVAFDPFILQRAIDPKSVGQPPE